MKEWAIEKGATHYTHWFQPMTGITAEKHDSFITPAGRRRGDYGVFRQGADQGRAGRVFLPVGRAARDLRGAGLHRVGPHLLRLRQGQHAVHSRPPSAPTAARRWTRRRRCCARWRRSTSRRSASCACSGETTPSACIRPSAPEQEYFLIDEELYERRKDLIYTRAHPVRREAAEGAGAGGPLLRHHQAARHGVHGTSWTRSCGSWASSPRPSTTRSRPRSTSWPRSLRPPTSPPTTTSSRWS